MKKMTFKTFMAIIFVAIFSIGSAHATAISFVATDLADITVGEDLWEYTYTVSENTFDTDYGFTIFFDYNLYGAIDPSPISPNTDWDVLTWAPDTSIPDDGAFDALSLTDGASLADSFTVSFVWLGSNAPGSQYFEVYDPSFSTIETGNAVAGVSAPIPEPATMLLLGTGLVGLVGYRKKFKEIR